MERLHEHQNAIRKKEMKQQRAVGQLINTLTPTTKNDYGRIHLMATKSALKSFQKAFKHTHTGNKAKLYLKQLYKENPITRTRMTDLAKRVLNDPNVTPLIKKEYEMDRTKVSCILSNGTEIFVPPKDDERPLTQRLAFFDEFKVLNNREEATKAASELIDSLFVGEPDKRAKFITELNKMFVFNFT